MTDRVRRASDSDDGDSDDGDYIEVYAFGVKDPIRSFSTKTEEVLDVEPRSSTAKR
jgi:hypothetical protein